MRLVLSPFDVLETSYTTKHKRAIRGMSAILMSNSSSSSQVQSPLLTIFSDVLTHSHNALPP